MTAITKAWVTIADGAVDPDSPIDAALMTGLRDNGIHVREWIGASYYAGAVQNHNHDGLNSANVVLADASIATPKYIDGSVTNPKLAGPLLVPLVRADVAALNSGAVTLPNVQTNITTVDLGTVTNGDRILVSGFYVFTGGSGTVDSRVTKNSGTATITALSSSGSLYGSTCNGAAGQCMVSGVIKVTGTGTLVLALTGSDSGASASIAINLGQLHAMVLKGG